MIPTSMISYKTESGQEIIECLKKITGDRNNVIDVIRLEHVRSLIEFLWIYVS
jgi:hypothetical protein